MKKMKFRIYKDSYGDWGWVLFGLNKQEISRSLVEFKRKSDCVSQVSKIQARVMDAEVEIKED